jgi:hypothetical protein
VWQRALAFVVGAAVSGLGARSASAQSLGAVAKQEEERRKTVKSSGKVYTNDNIKPAPTTTATPSGDAPTPAASSGGTASSASPTQGTDEKDEKYWRNRIADERDAAAKARTLVDALQSQVNGLWAEFTACQSPPQCTQLANKRQKALQDLEQAKKDVEAHNKRIGDIQDEARKAGVPAGWVR